MMDASLRYLDDHVRSVLRTKGVATVEEIANVGLGGHMLPVHGSLARLGLKGEVRRVIVTMFDLSVTWWYGVTKRGA